MDNSKDIQEENLALYERIQELEAANESLFIGLEYNKEQLKLLEATAKDRLLCINAVQAELTRLSRDLGNLGSTQLSTFDVVSLDIGIKQLINFTRSFVKYER